MKLSSFVSFHPKGGDAGDATSLAMQKIAANVQQKLRSHINPGIDLKHAHRAQSIRARASGGSIIIDEDDRAALFSGGMSKSQEGSGGVAELFNPSSGVPESIEQSGSGTRVVFRSVEMEKMFAQQAELQQNDSVQRVISNTIRTTLVNAFESSIEQVRRQEGK